jgi:hypothetical protein
MSDRSESKPFSIVEVVKKEVERLRKQTKIRGTEKAGNVVGGIRKRKEEESRKEEERSRKEEEKSKKKKGEQRKRIKLLEEEVKQKEEECREKDEESKRKGEESKRKEEERRKQIKYVTFFYGLLIKNI